MGIPYWLLKLIPLFDYICPKCKKEVAKNSHKCPYCGEQFGIPVRVPPKVLKDPKALEEYVHKHIFPKISANQRAYLTQFFSVLFEDGFESGDFSAWTSTYANGSITVTVGSTVPHHGTYHMQVAGIRWVGEYGYAKKTITPQTDLYMRAYGRMEDLFTATGRVLFGFYFRGNNDATPIAWCGFEKDATGYRWYVNVRAGALEYRSDYVTLNAGQWYCIELRVKVGASDGIVTLWIDGVQQINQVNINTGTTSIDTVHLRAQRIDENEPAERTVYYDCVVVADKGPIGPEAPLPFNVTVTPSSATLYVGQSLTFTASVSGGTPPYSVRWIDATTGIEIGTGTTYTFVATEVGTYQIYAQATDATGATANSSAVTITVSEMPPAELWDNCDQVNGWKVHSSKEYPNTGDNVIEVDTVDKVEGAASLKMTFGATGSNWGGYFYKEGLWNFKDKPVLRMRFKAQKALPANFKFAIRSGSRGAWSGYHILDKITTIGEWLLIDVDLRLPDEGEMFPDLSNVVWVEFQNWGFISEPTPFNVDYMEKFMGPVIPLDARIKPESAWTIVGSPVMFSVDVKGGVEPYSFSWTVNGTMQPETTSTFTFTPSVAGNFTIKCTVTDAQGTTKDVQASVTVAEPPPPQPPPPPSVDVFKSEIRAMYFDDWLYRKPNWTRMAETCLKYGINTIVIGVSVTELWDRKSGQVYFNQLLYQGVKTFQSYGFKVHILADICFNHVEGMTVTLPDGSTETWLCLTKKATRQMWKAIMESLVRDYGIDGFMFDYIRWRTTQMCFCNECKAKFISDTGLTDVNWPTDCLEGGRYYWQFIQWRLNPITEFVRDAVQWMRAIKPDLVTSAAVFTAFDNCGNYWVMSIGQHVADWVDRGYLDFVSPMMYSKVASTVTMYLQNSLNFYTGGAEGKIPMVPFITFLDMSIDEYTPMPIQNFIDVVSALKQNGADGYIIYKYGGPGFEDDPSPRKFADARPHLAALIDAGLIPPVWAIQNLAVTTNPEKTQATISWTTTVPTTSKIEYSDNPIFVGTDRYGDFGRPLHYKDIDYVGGTVTEDTTLKTNHSFTIPITPSTQFRIQATDENGVKVTSPTMLVIEAITVTYTLTIATTTGGTTNPAPGTYTYPSGASVTVTAIPSSGYIFDHWELDGVDAGKVNPITVTMDKDHSLTAYFSPTPIIPPKITGPLGLWTFPLMTRLAAIFPILATLLERLKRK